MSSLFGKERRMIYRRRIASFWDEYRRTKVGILGLTLLLIFCGVAILAPWISPYDPTLQRRLGESFAMPAWVTVFPQYQDLPRTMRIPLGWTIQETPIATVEGGVGITVRYEGGFTQPFHMTFTSNFSYPYTPPETFTIKLNVFAEQVKNMSYYVQVYLIDPLGNQTRINPQHAITGAEDKVWFVEIQSTDYYLVRALGYPEETLIAELLLHQTGTYTVLFDITLSPLNSLSTMNLAIEDTVFTVPGKVHGILGADNEGRDLFSQLVYGAQISLAIGLAAALIGTGLGVVFGVIAGYLGGAVDEIMMRVVDILLCLPVLPLLLALIFLFGPNVMYIIILIALFGWQGLSRVIRSQILYLREMPFIECAVASGASKTYIIFRHLIPNILPTAFATLVLSVPGAILLEASLSFLGFGDPGAPTWGRMLQSAFSFGAFTNLAWWWILPPGIAIMLVCLSFAFIGHAVDNVVNPRLRRRR